MILSASDINLNLKMITRQYPKVTRLIFEDYSELGRPIYSVRIGLGKKTLICTGGVHGRESINPTVLVKMTKVYCAKYTDFLKTYSILFLPLLNPDGYEIALHKDKHWKYNGRGIDINRNFPCQSYCKKNPNDMPLSEVESRILVNIFNREDSIGYIDFHSRGKEIYWYRAALDENYNLKQKKLAQALCQCSGYRLGTPEDEMPDNSSGGNTVQYYSEQLKLPAITVETIDEDAEFPLDQAWLESTWQEIKEIPIQYIKSWSAQ